MALSWIFEVDWDKDGTYTDESARLVKVIVRRGRDRQFNSSGPEAVSPGELHIHVDNYDSRYDPYNAGGALYGYLLPGRPFRLKASDGSVTKHVITGYLIDIRPQGAKSQIAIIRGADGVAFLDMQKCDDITAQSNYLVASAINDLLDMSDWPLVSSAATYPYTFPLTLGAILIDDNGDKITTWDTNTSKTIWATMVEVAAAFLGTVFVTAEGSLKYITRNSSRPTSGTLTQDLLHKEIETRMPWDEVYNDIRVTPTSGTTQTASDTTSQSNYGRRTLTITNNDYIQSNAQAANVADTLELYLPELKRGFRVKLEDQFELQFGLDLFERVRIDLDALSVDGLFQIGKIEHDWQAGKGCVTTYTIEPDFNEVAGIETYPLTFSFLLGW